MRIFNNVCKGFSLTEVVLALGLSSVGLLSIVGLLGVSMQASRHAGDDAALAAMTAQVLAELDAAPFDALALADLQHVSSADSFDTLPATLPDSVYYFSEQGRRVPPTGTDLENTPVYACRVGKVPDEATRGVGNGAYNLVHVELHFSWPVEAHSDPEQRPGQSRVYASMARY